MEQIREEIGLDDDSISTFAQRYLFPEANRYFPGDEVGDFAYSKVANLLEKAPNRYLKAINSRIEKNMSEAGKLIAREMGVELVGAYLKVRERYPEIDVGQRISLKNFQDKMDRSPVQVEHEIRCRLREKGFGWHEGYLDEVRFAGQAYLKRLEEFGII